MWEAFSSTFGNSGAGGAGGGSGMNLAGNIFGTLGGIWGGMQSHKLAKDSFKFQKNMAKKNYANQVQSYNTALTDRAVARGATQGDSQATTDQYLQANRLPG